MEFLVLVAIILSIVSIVRANGAKERIESLLTRLTALELELRRLRERLPEDSAPKKSIAPILPIQPTPQTNTQQAPPIPPPFPAPAKPPEHPSQPDQTAGEESWDKPAEN